MRRRLGALDRADARARREGGAWSGDTIATALDWQARGNPRDWQPARAPQSPRHRVRPARRGNRRTAAVMVLLLLAGAVALREFEARNPAAAARLAATAGAVDRPPSGVDEAARPLGAPSAVAGVGDYAFLGTQRGSTAPVTWDPCRPIRYVVYGTPPPGAENVVAQAVAQISAATGLRFQAVGTTTELPASAGRAPYQPQRYGRRWAPLVVAWTDPQRTPRLEGNVVGLGGGEAVADGTGHLTYVTGSVWLDEPDLARHLTDEGPTAVAMVRAVALHELGHAVGLDHVKDASQIMYPEAQLQTTVLGAGDRRGLAMLGRGACAPGL